MWFFAFLLKRYLNINAYHKTTYNFDKCSFCSSTEKEIYITKTIPDFNINVLSYSIAKRFYTRSIGRCLKCNLIQEYNKFSKSELKRYFEEITLKIILSMKMYGKLPRTQKYKNFYIIDILKKI